MPRTLFSILAGVVSLLVFGGSVRAQDTVKIGIVTDHTGNAAEYARIEEQGLELALKEINAAGGVLGKKIELSYEDDEDKPALSATKVRKLASSGVALIIQLSSSTSTQQAESASLETKVPHIGANQSADTLNRRNSTIRISSSPACQARSSSRRCSLTPRRNTRPPPFSPTLRESHNSLPRLSARERPTPE